MQAGRRRGKTARIPGMGEAPGRVQETFSFCSFNAFGWLGSRSHSQGAAQPLARLKVSRLWQQPSRKATDIFDLKPYNNNTSNHKTRASGARQRSTDLPSATGIFFLSLRTPGAAEPRPQAHACSTRVSQPGYQISWKERTRRPYRCTHSPVDLAGVASRGLQHKHILLTLADGVELRIAGSAGPGGS